MGYTHYYYQRDDISDEAWLNIIVDAQKIIDHVEPDIKLESNDPNGVMLTNRRINLNGQDLGQDLGHETFYVAKDRESEEDFGFCKTARKPYDIVVQSILMIIEHHYSKFGKISSDGDPEEWKDAAKLNAEVLGYAYQIPAEVGPPEQIEAITKQIFEELKSNSDNNSKKIKIK